MPRISAWPRAVMASRYASTTGRSSGSDGGEQVRAVQRCAGLHPRIGRGELGAEVHALLAVGTTGGELALEGEPAPPGPAAAGPWRSWPSPPPGGRTVPRSAPRGAAAGPRPRRGRSRRRSRTPGRRRRSSPPRRFGRRRRPRAGPRRSPAGTPPPGRLRTRWTAVGRPAVHWRNSASRPPCPARSAVGHTWSAGRPERPNADSSHVTCTGSAGRRGIAAASMDHAERTLETAVYAMAEGIATRDQIALLEADTRAWRLMLERLIDDTEDQLEDVRRIQGPERDQVVADFAERAGSPRRLLRPADQGHRPAGGHRRGRPRRRGAPPGFLGGRQDRRVGCRSRAPLPRRTTSSPIASRPSAVPSSAGPCTPTCRCRRAPARRRSPSPCRSRSVGSSPSVVGSAATAWAPAWCGSGGWRWPPCAWSRRARSCPR